MAPTRIFADHTRPSEHNAAIAALVVRMANENPAGLAETWFNGDLGLVELEPSTLDIWGGVEEALETRLLVVAQEVGPRDRDHRCNADGQDRQPTKACARHPQHSGQDRRKDEGRAEVGLEHDERQGRANEHGQWNRVFVEQGKRGLRTKAEPEERELTLARAKIGELMMRLELAEDLIEKRGFTDEWKRRRG